METVVSPVICNEVILAEVQGVAFEAWNCAG